MRLYRLQGMEAASPVSAWISESPEYRNMKAAAGRWFADSIDEAQWYACDHEDGFIVCVDLDDEEAEQWRVCNVPLKPGGREVPDNPFAWSLRPEREFFLPIELAAMARPLDPNDDQEIEKAAPHM